MAGQKKPKRRFEFCKIPGWPSTVQFTSNAPAKSIFTGQTLVLRARLTFGDRTGFWDRIPRIGPILQRAPQEHFHRTKTRFKGAFDFWGQNGVLGQNSPNWPNSPAYPQEHFHRTKTRFKGAFDFGDKTGPWLFILITSTMGSITF